MNVQADSGGAQLDGSDMVVHYNPAVLKVTSFTAGSIFPSTPALANNAAIGEINISSLANKGQPVIVSGTLATIQFQVIGSGQTLVTLDFVSNSKSRTAMAQDGTVNQVLNTAFSASYTAGMLLFLKITPPSPRRLQPQIQEKPLLFRPVPTMNY